jgi:hypothetical protein
MEDIPNGLDRLTARLEALEQRVCALEHPAGVTGAITEEQTSPATAIEGSDKLTSATTAGVFSLLGKAMLGIAGAYLLRAVAESNVVPSAAIAGVAIAYALAWLVWASRAKDDDWLTGIIFACTSALILAPMLWELMLRFKVLSALTTAAVVAGFVVAASMLAWKRELTPVLWVANLTAAALVLGLAITSREIVPFAGVLLLMVLIGELGALRGKTGGVRVMVSMAADAVIWALVFIYQSAESTRASYPQLGAVALIVPGVLLFLIFSTSVILRTLIARRQITVFETMQTMAAFLLAACSYLYFGPATSAMRFGIACLVLAGAGYGVAATCFSGNEDRRNLLVFTSWSGALMLAGSMMCLPAKVQSPWLGSWAVAASWASARMLRVHLELHGLAFLLAAAVGSGLLNWVLCELAGTSQGNAHLAMYFVTVCAIACYVFAARKSAEGWRQQWIAISFALLASAAVTSLLVQGFMGLVALKVIPGVHHLAFIRTLTICLAATGLAFGAARWGRTELSRISYATVALLAVKLAVEDLRHGQLAFIAGSISLFAITLILVPRMARVGLRVKDAIVTKDQGVSSLL